MPGLNDQHRDYIDRDSSFLMGVPDRKLIQKGDGEEEEAKEPEAGSDAGS